MSTQITKTDFRDFIRIVFICLCWYAVSSANGVLGKTILSQFPYPMTVTMVQLASIALWSTPVLKMLDVRKQEASTWDYYKKMLIPLALAKFLSSVLSHISIWKVPVSYAHTVKASMPLFTVFISRIAFGETHSWSLYFSLIPIVSGVALATVSEISFDIVGLGSALMSTAGFSLMNIFSKQALKATGMHHLRLLHLLGQMAACMFLPVWLLVDAPRIGEELTVDIVILLLVDGVFHWLQNIMAFTLLKLVIPLTYAVANVTKRIAVISVSLLLLKNPVNASNVTGMLLAIGGVFCYNMAKFRENVAKDSLPVLMPKTNKTKPIWENHYTLDNSKVQVTTPLSYMPEQGYNMKRTQ